MPSAKTESDASNRNQRCAASRSASRTHACAKIPAPAVKQPAGHSKTRAFARALANNNLTVRPWPSLSAPTHAPIMRDRIIRPALYFPHATSTAVKRVRGRHAPLDACLRAPPTRSCKSDPSRVCAWIALRLPMGSKSRSTCVAVATTTCFRAPAIAWPPARCRFARRTSASANKSASAIRLPAAPRARVPSAAAALTRRMAKKEPKWRLRSAPAAARARRRRAPHCRAVLRTSASSARSASARHRVAKA